MYRLVGHARVGAFSRHADCEIRCTVHTVRWMGRTTKPVIETDTQTRHTHSLWRYGDEDLAENTLVLPEVDRKRVCSRGWWINRPSSSCRVIDIHPCRHSSTTTKKSTLTPSSLTHSLAHSLRASLVTRTRTADRSCSIQGDTLVGSDACTASVNAQAQLTTHFKDEESRTYCRPTAE